MTPNSTSTTKTTRFRHNALRTRFVLGTGVMLMPLLILAVLGYLKFEYVVERMDNVVHGVFQELVPLAYLDNASQRARYLTYRAAQANGDNVNDEFERLAAGIDRAFRKMLDMGTPLPDAITTDVSAARHAWLQVHNEGHKLFDKSGLRAHNKPFDPEVLRHGLAQMEQHLAHAHARILQKIDRQLHQTRTIQRQVLSLIFITAVAGMVVALLAAYLLARTMLTPLSQLQHATTRLAAGDLAARVPNLSSQEFNRLAQTFNHMARMLQSHEADLRRMAIHDGLTGLYNRREFQSRLYQEIERSRRYAHSFALLLLDIDFFKRVNDTHGHPAGDHVLREIARVLNESTRPIDTAARYGGEEFAVVLPEAQDEGAFITAERIRRTIAAITLTLDDGAPLKLTVSIGIGLFPQHGHSAASLLEMTDQALYKAKTTGRNRVVMATAINSAPDH